MHLIKGAFRTKSLALPAGCKTGFAEVVRSEAGDEICLGGCQVEKMEEALQVRDMLKGCTGQYSPKLCFSLFWLKKRKSLFH